MKAKDLLVLFSSFVPKGGAALSVKVKMKVLPVCGLRQTLSDV